MNGELGCRDTRGAMGRANEVTVIVLRKPDCGRHVDNGEAFRLVRPRSRRTGLRSATSPIWRTGSCSPSIPALKRGMVRSAMRLRRGFRASARSVSRAISRRKPSRMRCQSMPARSRSALSHLPQLPRSQWAVSSPARRVSVPSAGICLRGGSREPSRSRPRG